MFEHPQSLLFPKCGRKIFVLCLGHRIYKWMGLYVQTRVNDLLINLRDINHNVYFNTIKLGLYLVTIFTAEHNVYLTKCRNIQSVQCSI